MELTKSEKLQNLKTLIRRLANTLSSFDIINLQREFEKQLYHLALQARRMQEIYPQLAVQLKSISRICIQANKNRAPEARECFLRRLYVVSRELSDSLKLYRHSDRVEKLLSLKHYLETDMVIAQK